MANNLTGNPLYIDTQHASNVVIGNNVYIRAIKLIATGAAPSAILTGVTSSRVFWRGAGAASGETDFNELRVKTNETIAATTINNAIVLVYLGNEP